LRAGLVRVLVVARVVLVVVVVVCRGSDPLLSCCCCYCCCLWSVEAGDYWIDRERQFGAACRPGTKWVLEKERDVDDDDDSRVHQRDGAWDDERKDVSSCTVPIRRVRGTGGALVRESYRQGTTATRVDECLPRVYRPIGQSDGPIVVVETTWRTTTVIIPMIVEPSLFDLVDAVSVGPRVVVLVLRAGVG
jgi:hypothetical protein